MFFSKKTSYLLTKNRMLPFIAFQLMISVAYLLIQNENRLDTTDIGYVLLIFINSCLVYWALKSQYKILLNNKSKLFGENDSDTVTRIFSDFNMLVFGLLYGAFFYGASYASDFKIYNEDVINWLRVLLFSHTVIVGMAVYCLCLFFYYINEVANSITVSLWNKDSEALNAFSESTVTNIIFVAFIVSIAITCVYFSFFKLDPRLLWLFSAFSLFFLLAAYYFSYAPINRRMVKLKREKLNDIANMIDKEYAGQISNLKNKSNTFDLDEFESLSLLYKRTKEAPLYFSLNMQSTKILFAIFSSIILPYISQLIVKLVS